MDYPVVMEVNAERKETILREGVYRHGCTSL